MSYFRELPDLEYQSTLIDKKSSKDYIKVKNLFRRVKLLDWLQNKVTLFYKYQILEGSRPDIVAEEVYGSPDYDWVILLTSNITNVQHQWPLSNKDLYIYAENKYGVNLNNIHHYETFEVRDDLGRLILPAGQVVDKNFTITESYDSKYIGITEYESFNLTSDTTGKINPVVGISNYQYETKLNEEKRTIYILKPDYLQQFINDMRFVMKYREGSEYVNKVLSRTENTRLIGP